jgi:hypothetical protein
MGRTMTISQGGASVEINLPKYGYEAKIHMPMRSFHSSDGNYSFFDPRDPDTRLLGAYDYRTCKCTLWNNEVNKSYFNVFMLNATKGRAKTFTLELGSDPTGFFPGGPDWGDKGTFTIREIDRQQTGIMFGPWKWFQDEFEFIVVSHPAYTLPTEVSQGNFEIGSIQKLMMPQGGFRPKIDYNFSTGLSSSGAPHSLDSTKYADNWESSWEQELNTSKAAALCDYFVANREQPMAVVSPANFYTFGMDQYDSEVYEAKFLGSENDGNELVINAKHIGFNQWIIPINMWLKESKIA